MSYGSNTYKKTAVNTATPEQILLMLYEGAIRFSKLAKKSMETGNVKDKCIYIGKVHDIVIELNNTLDPKKDAEIAAQLEALYNFCVSQLIEANMSNNLKSLDSVIQILTTLYEGWVAAVKQVREENGSGKT